MDETKDTMEKKRPLNDLLRSTMDKVHEMVDTNTIVGEPIATADGVTLIPISRVSLGIGCGGGDYGKVQPKDFGGGSAAGVKIEPVAFLVIKEGTTRVLPVAMPAVTTLDRWWSWCRISSTRWKNISTEKTRHRRTDRGILPSLNK